jgi:hypothetical protein
MVRLEKRLTSFMRKHTLSGKPYNKWTLHKSYSTLEDALQAYENLVAKYHNGHNFRIVHDGAVIKQKNT